MTRDPLTKPAVIRAAVGMADEQGLDALTMRLLGERLGVQAMALYRHITGREALLDAMTAELTNHLAEQLRAATGSLTSSSAYLEQAARDIRDLALAHPWLIRLMVSRPAPDAAVSPPLSGLACTESVLDALSRCGLDRCSSVQTYRAFCAFLLGQLLLEIPVAGSRPSADRGPRHTLARYPRTSSHVDLLTETDQPAEFERSLRNFLRSVRATRTG